jgi:ASC-1-like (ASCH) protein
MAIIKKKIDLEYFELIKSGKKNFEVRLADFKIKEGDILILEEKDKKSKKLTGRRIEKKVKDVFYKPLQNLGRIKDLVKYGIYVIQLED